jgi:hypothetical protein
MTPLADNPFATLVRLAFRVLEAEVGLAPPSG